MTTRLSSTHKHSDISRQFSKEISQQFLMLVYVQILYFVNLGLINMYMYY